LFAVTTLCHTHNGILRQQKSAKPMECQIRPPSFAVDPHPGPQNLPFSQPCKEKSMWYYCPLHLGPCYALAEAVMELGSPVNEHCRPPEKTIEIQETLFNMIYVDIHP
jgi:hypothetical protein